MAAEFRALVAAERGGWGVLIADTETGVILPAERIRTADVLENLMRAEGVCVGWDIDATVNCWANDLPEDVRMRLMSSLPTEWDGWKLLYVPGRFFDVRWDGYRLRTESDGSPRERGGCLPTRARRTYYDLSSFWPGQKHDLVRIAAQWGIVAPSIVQAGEDARPWEFEGWTRTAIAEWASERASIIAYLAACLDARLTGLGISLTQYHGVGAIGNHLLRAAGGNKWVAHYSPRRQPIIDGVELLPLMMRAFYGGRIETTVAGAFDAPSWRLDMRSAYAWAMSWLGPVGFKWRHVESFDPNPASRMALYRVRWNVPQAWICPFPWRDGTRRGTAYPRSGEGWYWWPEVKAALQLYGPEAIQVHEGYVSPGSSLRPLADSMAGWYRTRLELDTEHDPIVPVIKGGMNGVWGKLAQTLGANGRPGQYYNPALAGWVTSAVRARLLTSIGANDLQTAALMTDGYLTAVEPSPDQLAATLGGWRVERFERGELVMPGMYRLFRADGSVTVASSGMHRSVDFDWLLGELTANAKAQISGRWFVPHVLADIWPESWGHTRCRWMTSTPTINPWSVARKRMGAASIGVGFDWRSDLRSLGPYNAIGHHLSAPYHGPASWSRDGFDPLLEAAKMALSAAG